MNVLGRTGRTGTLVNNDNIVPGKNPHERHGCGQQGEVKSEFLMGVSKNCPTSHQHFSVHLQGTLPTSLCEKVGSWGSTNKQFDLSDPPPPPVGKMPMISPKTKHEMIRNCLNVLQFQN